METAVQGSAPSTADSISAFMENRPAPPPESPETTPATEAPAETATKTPEVTPAPEGKSDDLDLSGAVDAPKPQAKVPELSEQELQKKEKALLEGPAKPLRQAYEKNKEELKRLQSELVTLRAQPKT